MKKVVSVILVLALAVGMFAFSGCGEEKTKLHVYNWGVNIADGSDDYIDVIAEFEEAYPEIDVIYDTYESNEATGKPGAIDHLALKARDIEAAFEAVKALGYDLVNEQIEFLPFWDRGVRYFTFYGPNREKIEFSQML